MRGCARRWRTCMSAAATTEAGKSIVDEHAGRRKVVRLLGTSDAASFGACLGALAYAERSVRDVRQRRRDVGGLECRGHIAMGPLPRPKSVQSAERHGLDVPPQSSVAESSGGKSGSAA